MVPIRSAVDLVLQDRRRLFICAAIGALLLSCFVTLYASVDGVFGDLLLNPLDAASLFLGPAVLLVGLFASGLAVLLWSCLRILVVRALLQYNGWFLNPKSPINKVSTLYNTCRSISCIFVKFKDMVFHDGCTSWKKESWERILSGLSSVSSCPLVEEDLPKVS